MAEKRFTYDSKTVSILKDGEVWLDGNVDTACNHSEICNELNKLAEENEQLKTDIEYYKIERCALFEYLDKKDDLELELKVIK